MSGGQKSIERQAGTRVMHAPLTQDWSTTAESAALGDVTPGPCLPLAPGPRIRNLTSSFLPEEGFPGGSDSKESACNAGDRVQSLGQEDPLEKEMATPIFLPGESHGQRSLAGYSPWGRKELDTTEGLYSLMEKANELN